jgi:hypothetical protein
VFDLDLVVIKDSWILLMDWVIDTIQKCLAPIYWLDAELLAQHKVEVPPLPAQCSAELEPALA